MGTGTAAMGRKSGKKTHIMCRRCGNRTYHKTKKKCSKCGYGAISKRRNYSWQKK